MAKDLPYFKFYCSEWNDGDITLEDFEVQGLFINVCSYYWSNECDLSIEKLKKRFKKSIKNIDLLLECKLIRKENGFLKINFLDEQKSDRNKTSTKNSIAGKASAESKRLKKTEKLNQDSTPVEITLNGNSTIKKRGEEKREEEKENSFNFFWSEYPNKVAKPKCKAKFLSLKQDDIDKIVRTLKSYIAYKPFEEYNHPNPLTYLNQERWNDEVKAVSTVVTHSYPVN